jgi:hypothetical protein
MKVSYKTKSKIKKKAIQALKKKKKTKKSKKNFKSTSNGKRYY